MSMFGFRQPAGATSLRTRRMAHTGRPMDADFVGICRQIEKAKLTPSVRDQAIEIFEALGHAEARVHQTTLEKVHFHEVGAADALVDIVGACVAIHRMGITQVTSSPVALGHGKDRVRSRHITAAGSSHAGTPERASYSSGPRRMGDRDTDGCGVVASSRR